MDFALEERSGYLESSLCAAPGLSRCAQILRTQHRCLYSETWAIFEQAEQRLHREVRASTPRGIVQRFTAFCCHLQEHEAREDDLILLAPSTRARRLDNSYPMSHT
jgi:hypothetical protein